MLDVMNKVLKDFMHALDADQQSAFAEAAGTSVGALRHYVTGRRHASSAMAIALERAARKVRLGSEEKLPPLNRTDLSLACRHCDYAKACMKARGK